MRVFCIDFSLCLTHAQTKMSLFKFKGVGMAKRADSPHHRTAETTDGHSSKGLLPHIRPTPNSSLFTSPPSAVIPHPPLFLPSVGSSKSCPSNHQVCRGSIFPPLPSSSLVSPHFSTSPSQMETITLVSVSNPLPSPCHTKITQPLTNPYTPPPFKLLFLSSVALILAFLCTQ